MRITSTFLECKGCKTQLKRNSSLNTRYPVIPIFRVTFIGRRLQTKRYIRLFTTSTPINTIQIHYMFQEQQGNLMVCKYPSICNTITFLARFPFNSLPNSISFPANQSLIFNKSNECFVFPAILSAN